MKPKESSRRAFLRQSIVLTAGSLAIPHFLNANGRVRTQLFGANERVNLACCGIGNRGGEIIKALYDTGLANIVALCDVDMEAPHTQKVIKLFPEAPRFKDFRTMFDKMSNQIDAVSIGVPDHAHFPIVMHAMGLGKHVYVEKPMAGTFRECEILMDAAKKHKKLVTQMGNQGHSEANYFQFKAWTEAGIIKDVTSIVGHMNAPRRWHGWDTNIKSYPPAQSIPSTLDWDEWLASRPQKEYNKEYVNGQWRCWYGLGLGALGDWGAHIFDTAHQFLNMGLPHEISAVKLEGHNDFFFPQASTLSFKFPKRGKMPPVEMMWYDGVNNLPPIPEGYGVSGLDPNIPPPSTGAIEENKLNPGKIIYSKELTFKGGSHGSTLSIIPEEKAKEMEAKLPEVPQSPSNHFKNFLLACKGEEETRSPFHIAGPLSQVMVLGTMAQQLNTKLEFDRKKRKITNNKEANEMLAGPPVRKGWEDYYRV